MQTLLIGASVLSLLLAVIMTIVASKVLRLNRARSAARVTALQALVADTAESPVAVELDQELPVAAPMEPAFVLPTIRHADAFDLALRQDPPVRPAIVTVDVRSSLFEEPTQRTPSRRWTWMAATGLLMASVVGIIYVVSSGVIGRTVAAHNATTAAASASPIELLSLRHSIDASGTFIVTGLVQNPIASASLQGVAAVVYLFDAEGKYFASSHAALESAVLSPGGHAAFTVRVPLSSLPSPSSLSTVPSISQYRVSFQHADGAAVIHVDRRGALPERTTGDTVEAAPSATPLVAAQRIR